MLIRPSALALWLACTTAAAQVRFITDDPLNTPDQLAQYEANGAVVGDISIVVENVFNPENPEENKYFHRVANRLHITTRTRVVDDILLFDVGDRFSRQLIEESARLLRRSPWIADARVGVLRYDPASNTVDIEARIRDAWSFTPELSFGRNGGTNEVSIALSESNLLGLGKDVVVAYDASVDRTERFVSYSDPNLRGGRARLDVSLGNNSDGDRYHVFLRRPFFALDARWAAGSEFLDVEQIDSIYDLGEIVDEFTRNRRYMELSGGWSRGLVADRSLRWLVGTVYDDNQFSPTTDVPDPLLLPPDRKLVYPTIGLQFVVNDFREMSNLFTMGRTEDISFGLDLGIQLGYASTRFGADRRAWIASLGARKGWQPSAESFVFLSTAARARIEGTEARNASLGLNVRYMQRNLDRRHLFTVNLDALTTQHLDPDQQVLLGGDSGLRGYPLRYQAGEHRAVLNLEQRFFTEWYPWRLVHVGSALFLDAGRTWGQDPRGTPSRGMLYDAGFGLRLVSTRASRGNIVHIDLAFPLNGEPGVDSVQLLIETKGSF